MSEKLQITISLSSSFLEGWLRLPKHIAEKTARFIEKFRSDPTSPGLNYETIRNASSHNMRSVRIDQEYRGIVYKPQKGNVYLLLWVDKHDEAYAWATRARCEVHPETGSIQLWFAKCEEALSPLYTPTEEKGRAIFSHLSERKLLMLGVPQEQLHSVKEIRSEEELARLTPLLPQEAAEALHWIFSGDSFDEVYQAVIESKVDCVDTEDFEAALNHPETKRRFFVVNDDSELEALLNAPLDKWRVFLHPSQRKLVEKRWNGPVRVLGGAGTGKTVAAMHRAKWLAKNCYKGQEKKILFTTYTKNLAVDISQNLEKICTEEEMRSIDVMHIDGWVASFIKKNNRQYSLYYHKRGCSYWEEALSLHAAGQHFPAPFYREEWEEVILRQGIHREIDYLRTPRLGRGKALTRQNRIAVWKVFEGYREILSRNRLKEREDAFRDARELLLSGGAELPYTSVIVDEAQDMGNEAFKLLQQIVAGKSAENSLFITGDAHQRIYGRQVTLSQCGIDIRGRGRKLKINYRTTEQNRKWAVSILQEIPFDDFDGGSDDQEGYLSLLQGIEPKILSFPSIEEEAKGIADLIARGEGDGEGRSICLVARTKELRDTYKELLESHGVVVCTLDDKQREEKSAPGIRAATMHRVKGLEFDRVVIAGANDSPANFEPEKLERSLLYVAITRARKEVFITHSGAPSPLLPRKKNEEQS